MWCLILTLDQPKGLFKCYACCLSNCISCIFHALNCVACHAYHAFLKLCMNACLLWVVWCLDLRRETKNFLQLKLLPLPFLSKASGIHEISYIFCLCMFSLIYLSYACVEKYCYAKTNISLILDVSSTQVNLVESVAMQKVIYSNVKFY